MSNIIKPRARREPNRETIGSVVRRVGIPTLLEGVQFRSRIEATWASFFSSAKVSWDYEPRDLGGWIPDFELKFAARPLLIEVKSDNEDIELAQSKIECSAWEGEVAVVVDAKTAKLGKIYEADLGWSDCVMAWCLSCKLPTICSDSGRWLCRTCGEGQGVLWFGWSPRRDWDAAKNVTQWRKPA